MLAASVMMVAAGQANADTIDTTQWAFYGLDPGTGSTVYGIGTFTTEEFDDNSIKVLAVTGTIYDPYVVAGPIQITGLAPAYAGADNTLYDILQTSAADFGGISFTTNVGTDFNIGLGGNTALGSGFGYVLNDSKNNPGGNPPSGTAFDQGSVNITFNTCDSDDPDEAGCSVSDGQPVTMPEPSSAALLAVATVTLGVISRRYRHA